MNVILHDWTNNVNISHNRNNIHKLIHSKIEKLRFSVKEFKPNFIKTNDKNINQRLSKNLLNNTTLSIREKKLTHTAHKNINGRATTVTSKLNHIIHKIEVGIIVQTLAHKITAKAEVNDNIPVPTKAKTNTDITLELCKTAVVKIPLKNDFTSDEVNFFIKFLNHHQENNETDCSI